MTKHRSSRKNNHKRKASPPCDGGGKSASGDSQLQLLKFDFSTTGGTTTSLEIRSSEKLQATRLCRSLDTNSSSRTVSSSSCKQQFAKLGGFDQYHSHHYHHQQQQQQQHYQQTHPEQDFTLCDMIFDAASSRICLPRELWDNDLIESVSAAALHLLFGVRNATSDESPNATEAEDDESAAPELPKQLHLVAWLASGRHAILLPDEGRPALVADLSTDCDHMDHSAALTLQEEIPLKKCRLPRFAVHQTMATVTVVFFMQNVDRDSVAFTFCHCNSALRVEFCLDNECHTTYRIALGHPSIEHALAFPQSVRVDVIRDSVLVVYLDKAEDAHTLWTEILVGAAGTSSLKTYSLVDNNAIEDKLYGSLTSNAAIGCGMNSSEISMKPTLERRLSASCDSTHPCPTSPDIVGRGILKNRRLCSRTLSECSDSLEFSSWDLSESLRSSSASATNLDDVKRVTFNNKVLETKYRPEGISIKRRSQRTRSLSDSSDPDESEEADSICDDLRAGLTLSTESATSSPLREHANVCQAKEDLFHLEMEVK